jgi:hypothetical protein
MGSSASISINKESSFDIFISYPFCEEGKFNYEIEKLQYNLGLLDYKILTSSFTSDCINKSTENLLSINSNIHPLLFTIPFIFICLSSKTIHSVNQNLELNNISNINPSDVNVIYLIIDKDFTPDNSNESNVIIKNKKWLPFYDEYTTFETTNKIITMLINFTSNK